jgi:hypothetical protein
MQGNAGDEANSSGNHNAERKAMNKLQTAPASYFSWSNTYMFAKFMASFTAPSLSHDAPSSDG